MAVNIDKKIVGYQVKDKAKGEIKEAGGTAAQPESNSEQGGKKSADIIRMHEKVERPEGMECLEGATYKIRTPLDDHALYVTINDIVLNYGTEHEVRRPFEIFINSKNMDHFQWIVALTRVMSAVIEHHFKRIGLLEPDELSEQQQLMLKEKRAEFEAREAGGTVNPDALPEKKTMNEAAGEAEDTGYPAAASLCFKCNTKAMVLLDGCQTCLACGYSKCG